MSYIYGELRLSCVCAALDLSPATVRALVADGALRRVGGPGKNVTKATRFDGGDVARLAEALAANREPATKGAAE